MKGNGVSNVPSRVADRIDQASHLIDLARWFRGEFTDVYAALRTFFWEAEVEDNAFSHLVKSDGRLHSCTRLVPSGRTCSLSALHGRDGKLEMNGLGGPYKWAWRFLGGRKPHLLPHVA